MAINESRLTVTEFDFDEVKNNLKLFLKAQTEFKDYDFEGSGMNILLDVLAYNTHYLGFNANMLANEMFLDSASLRSSIISHAKTLGYVPTSARAAKATVDITLNTTTLATATMSAGTIFTTSVDGTDYQFVTASDVTASNIGSGIIFNDVDASNLIRNIRPAIVVKGKHFEKQLLPEQEAIRESGAKLEYFPEY